MASTSVFKVEFQIKKAGSGGAGKVDTYRKESRKVVVQAASAHPKDILVPLTNNVILGSGESIDIIAVEQVHVGSEGANVWS